MLLLTLLRLDKPDFQYSFESKPHSPPADRSPPTGLVNGVNSLQKDSAKTQIDTSGPKENALQNALSVSRGRSTPKRSDTMDSTRSEGSTRNRNASASSAINGTSHEDDTSITSGSSNERSFRPRPGYKQWVAQAGTLVADLLVSNYLGNYSFIATFIARVSGAKCPSSFLSTSQSFLTILSSTFKGNTDSEFSIDMRWCRPRNHDGPP